MKTRVFLSVLIVTASMIGCNSKNKGAAVGSNEETIKVLINDDTINQTNVWTIINPVWLSIDIYGSANDYHKSQEKFSENQRFVSAIMWYIAEVDNGGHSQFFENSTGIVWKDALEGFKRIGLIKNYNILKEATERIGGEPSLERENRIEQLEKANADFSDLDSTFYKTFPDSTILEYIKQNRKDFYFEGNVRKL